MNSFIEFADGYKVLKNFDEENEEWFGPYETEDEAKYAIEELEDLDMLDREFRPSSYHIVDPSGLMRPYTSYHAEEVME